MTAKQLSAIIKKIGFARSNGQCRLSRCVTTWSEGFDYEIEPWTWKLRGVTKPSFEDNRQEVVISYVAASRRVFGNSSPYRTEPGVALSMLSDRLTHDGVSHSYDVPAGRITLSISRY